MAAPFAPRKQVQILGADGHPLPPRHPGAAGRKLALAGGAGHGRACPMTPPTSGRITCRRGCRCCGRPTTSSTPIATGSSPGRAMRCATTVGRGCRHARARQRDGEFPAARKPDYRALASIAGFRRSTRSGPTNMAARSRHAGGPGPTIRDAGVTPARHDCLADVVCIPSLSGRRRRAGYPLLAARGSDRCCLVCHRAPGS